MRYSEIIPSTILQDAFECYQRNNLVVSQRSFSSKILGKPASYYSSMVTRNRKPSRAVLETLLTSTKTLVASFIGNPHLGMTYATNLNKAHEDLQNLINLITTDLEIGLVALQPNGDEV